MTPRLSSAERVACMAQGFAQSARHEEAAARRLCRRPATRAVGHRRPDGAYRISRFRCPSGTRNCRQCPALCGESSGLSAKTSDRESRSQVSQGTRLQRESLSPAAAITHERAGSQKVRQVRLKHPLFSNCWTEWGLNAGCSILQEGAKSRCKARSG